MSIRSINLAPASPSLSSAARHLFSAALLGSALALGACATPYDYYGPAAYAPPRAQYGVVEAIDVVTTGPAPSSGVGAVLGGIAGGVLGHQIGSGSGNTAATIAGAVGGAVVGNEVERQHQVPVSRYRITIRTDAGSTIQLMNRNDLNLRVGDRVRVEGNRVYRM
ncbi:MAG TPA: glycine zipper 2TM domain-containing protein [Casimicrobiaceae bacterium]|nr:glycine zipper 2TM domain-containing protein [Casimicrobiaceae bacterium]